MGVFESFPEKSEVPQPGIYRVKDTPEVQSAGGLRLHELVEDAEKKDEAGEAALQDKVVRIPAGASVTVERVFYSKREKTPFGIVTFKYHNDFKAADVDIRGCVNMNYLEKQSVAEATDPLQKMRQELQALQSEIGGKKA